MVLMILRDLYIFENSLAISKYKSSEKKLFYKYKYYIIVFILLDISNIIKILLYFENCKSLQKLIITFCNTCIYT
jgi:hypothetical protein